MRTCRTECPRAAALEKRDDDGTTVVVGTTTGEEEKALSSGEDLMRGERYVLVLKDVRLRRREMRRRRRNMVVVRSACGYSNGRAPRIVEAFKEFGKTGVTGTFYRSEAVPEVGAIDNYGGPGPDSDAPTPPPPQTRPRKDGSDAAGICPFGGKRVRVFDRRTRLVHCNRAALRMGTRPQRLGDS